MTNATSYSTEYAQLIGNAGGAVQSLPKVTMVGGRVRAFQADIPLAAQANGSVIGIARLPIGAAVNAITLNTDTSLGSSTIAIGDVASPAFLAAAATLTSVNTPIHVLTAAWVGQPITVGQDAVLGTQNASYEDLTITVGAAALPASGTLHVTINYVLD